MQPGTIPPVTAMPDRARNLRGSRTRARKLRGYTLIETLSALALAGLIAGGVGLALRTGLEASRRLRERSDAHSEARAMLDSLAADLAAAYLSSVNTEETRFVALPPEEALPGEPFLDFTTLGRRRAVGPAAGDGPGADLARVEYALEPAPSGSEAFAPERMLIRREQWVTATGPAPAEVVGERVLDLRLRFDGGEEGWSAAPELNPRLQVTEDEPVSPGASRSLPATVEITLILATGPRGAEPAPPRVYRTVVPLAAGSALPFEPEIVPRPSEQPASGDPGGGGPGP